MEHFSISLLVLSHRGFLALHIRVSSISIKGFKYSSHLLNKVLKEDLGDIDYILNSTVIQYVDDVILCLADRETCHKDSIKLLQIIKFLRRSCSMSRKKVVYLGQLITQGHRSISDSHLEAIRRAPKPRTVREMMAFLVIAGYSSAWVEEYAKLSGPLRAMIKETGSDQLHCNLAWTHNGHLAFETIKQKL